MTDDLRAAVKPLEWYQRELMTGATLANGRSPFGPYIAGIDLHGKPYWLWENDDESFDAASLDAAKAAAQADYADRVLSALTQDALAALRAKMAEGE